MSTIQQTASLTREAMETIAARYGMTLRFTARKDGCEVNAYDGATLYLGLERHLARLDAAAFSAKIAGKLEMEAAR